MAKKAVTPEETPVPPTIPEQELEQPRVGVPSFDLELRMGSVAADDIVVVQTLLWDIRRRYSNSSSLTIKEN